MRLILFLFALTTCIIGRSQQAGAPFRSFAQLGTPDGSKAYSFDTSTQVYEFAGTGEVFGKNKDDVYYAYTRISGDFILTADFKFMDPPSPANAIGWMIRASDETGALHLSGTVYGNGETAWVWRNERGGQSKKAELSSVALSDEYYTLQLQRRGSQLILRAAPYGAPLRTLGERPYDPMEATTLAGFFTCACNDNDQPAPVRLINIRMDRPVPGEYSGPIGKSRLETITIDNRARFVHYIDQEGIEAPNWMPNGQQLLINKQGSLYTLDLSDPDLAKLNTGFANGNNNDHGISFDGKTIAISHHREGFPEGGSTIYVLPIDGGKPRLVTEQTPSYWHGWAPNNKEVVYVAKREDDTDYNIFRANIETGQETQLTFHSGSHVDGPEYSPDGEWIYYNGSQNGTMQLWRMKPDGNGKEQLTFDEYYDWFPHISPDGKWIAFLSYLPTIPVNAHPRNQRVMLRLMPADGGEPTVLAHLYGGQGSFNVPSWSPDSRSVAFVSYAGRP